MKSRHNPLRHVSRRQWAAPTQEPCPLRLRLLPLAARIGAQQVRLFLPLHLQGRRF